MSVGHYTFRKWFLHRGWHPQLHAIDAKVQCHPSFHKAFCIIKIINIDFCKWLSIGLEWGSSSILLSVLRPHFEKNHPGPVHVSTVSIISHVHMYFLFSKSCFPWWVFSIPSVIDNTSTYTSIVFAESLGKGFYGDIPVMNVFSKFFHILKIVCLRVFVFVPIYHRRKTLNKTLIFEYSRMSLEWFFCYLTLWEHKYMQFYSFNSLYFSINTYICVHTHIYANIYTFSNN